MFSVKWLRVGVLLQLLLLPAGVHAQAVSGLLRGRVVDADFGAPVAGADVEVEGLGIRTKTDADGNFRLPGMEPGIYTVVASREDFVSARIRDVVVSAGEAKDVPVQLAAEVYELDDYVVSDADLLGESELDVVSIRQDIQNIGSVIGSEFLSQIGVRDVGAALQKGSGVSVIGGRVLVVRGLADRYNAVLVNGAPVPSSDPDKRSVNIDLFPSIIVANLVTTKSFLPELPGEGTGATVDILTKGVPDKPFAKVKVSLGYDTGATGNPNFRTYQGAGTGIFGTLDDRRIPDELRALGLDELPSVPVASALEKKLPREMGTRTKAPPANFGFETSAGTRFEFFGRPAGILVAADYAKSYDFEENALERRYAFNNAGEVFREGRITTVNRGIQKLRANAFGVMGVDLGEGDVVKLTGFVARTAEDTATLRIGPKFPENLTELDYKESLTYNQRTLRVLQLDGRHSFASPENTNPILVDWVGSFSMSSQDEPDHRFIEGSFFPADGIYSFPSNFDIPPVRRYWRELSDIRWALGADVTIPLFEETESGKQAELKLGGAFDHWERDYVSDNYAYSISPNNSFDYPSSVKPEPFPGATWGNAYLYGNPPADSVASLGQTTFLSRFTSQEFYTASQNVPSGFFQVKIPYLETWEAILGMRIEQTTIRIQASDIAGVKEVNIKPALLPPADRTPENINDLFDPVAAKNNPVIQAASRVNIDQVHFLPALQMRWDVARDVNLRAAYSRTIARPSFKELAPVATRDADTGDAFVGNSGLEISNIDNYDLRLEWVPDSGSLLAVNAFSKFIDRPIEKAAEQGIEQFVNGISARVYGFELELEQSLGFVDKSLSDLQFSANYSYIVSQSERGFPSTFGRFRRLQGQPDYLLNFNLTYNNDEYGIFAGMFLNVTGSYLDAEGAGFSTPDRFIAPRTTLNAVVQYSFGNGDKLSFRANNLTSTEERTYLNTQNLPVYELVKTSPVFSMSYEKSW